MLKKLFSSTYLHALLLGMLTAAALPPLNSLPITIIGITAFFFFYLRSPTKSLALYSYCFFTGYFIIGLYWIGNALLVEGNEFKWAWPLAVLGLPLALSLFYAAAGYITQRITPDNAIYTRILTLANTIALAELLRSILFTGFPWNLLGTAWSDFLPLIQISNIIGLLGMTWLMLMLCALLAIMFHKNNKTAYLRVGLGVLTIFLLNTAYGLYSINTKHNAGDTPMHVITIQPNIAQNEKWDPNLLTQNINKLIKTSEQALKELPELDKTPVLLIWPETALSYAIIENTDFFAQIMGRFSHYTERKITLLTGALTRSHVKKNSSYEYQNAVLMVDANGQIINQYNKSHLVPFGEYIPFQQYIPLETVTGFSGFAKGNGPEFMPLNQDIKILPKICYEIIFPHEFKTATRGTNAANAIVHITNDAWYGESSGPIQHQNLAIFRAAENNSHVFRSANKGVSAVIDSTGKPLNSTPINSRSYTSVKILLDKSNASLYILVGIWINFSIILFSYALILLCYNRKLIT